MATTIKVDTSLIDAAKRTVDSEKIKFDESWGKVLDISERLKETWKGADNTEFAAKVEGFKDDFDALSKRLEDYSNFLNTAKQKYDNAQSELTTTASKLQSDR